MRTGTSRRHAFRSMGTDVEVSGPEADIPAFEMVARRIESTFAEASAMFSRFRPDSELSHVNRRAGRWTTVSDPFTSLLGLALRAAEQTAGLFDPTVLNAMLAAGYDRDFAQIQGRGSIGPLAPKPCGRWSDVQLAGNQVKLPAGVGLDFGAIAKGWAVDLAAEIAKALPWALVNAGGDLRAIGNPPSGGLEIAVEDPLDQHAEILRVGLEAGALATSSVTSRAWGPRLHQVIDPRTGSPAVTTVIQATAWAETCADAEVRATWALLAGPSVLDRLPMVLVLEDGSVLTSLEQRVPVTA